MKKKTRPVPESMRDTSRWAMNRREFLKKTGGMAALVVLPYGGYRLGEWISGERMTGQTSRFKLTASQRQRLENVQDILFPSEPDAPGARDINAAEYLQAVLLDPRMDPEEMDFIINGLNWLEEEALERWEKSYNNMLPLEKEMLIEHVSGLDWGSSWLSTLLLFIFEALLSDPLYGGNPDGIGWKWLGYTPGQPRPKKKYDAYL